MPRRTNHSITHLARFCSNEHQQGETQRMGKSCCESLEDKAAGMEPEIIELKKLLLKEQIRISELKKSKLSLRPSKGALLVCFQQSTGSQ